MGAFLIAFIVPMVLGFWAQHRVKSTFAKNLEVPVANGLTGAQVARRILDANGLNEVPVEETPGALSDHYDPRSRTLRLSEAHYHGRSVAAAAIAAHEAGHAIQHARRYAPLALRTFYVPLAALGSNLSIPLILLGAIFHWPTLLLAGVILFSAVVLFQVLTLPVEFDASRRAKRILAESGLLTADHEARGVSSVLNAAAMTYVAATVQAVMTLLYYLYALGLLGGRRQ